MGEQFSVIHLIFFPCVEILPGSGRVSLPKKQSVVMKDAYVKLQPSRSDNTWSSAHRLATTGAETCPRACPSTVDRAHDQNDHIPKGPLLGGIGTMMAPTDPWHAGSSYNENEFCPSRLLSEKGFVEADDRNRVDPGHCGSSVSMENVFACHNVLTPFRPLSERSDEMEQFQHDPVSRGPMTSGVHSFFNNRIGEIRHSLNELSENERRGRDQALSAGFKEKTAQKHDKLASTKPRSDRDISKDGEMALLDSLRVQSSVCGNLAPAFSRNSDYWKFLESRQVFLSFALLSDISFSNDDFCTLIGSISSNSIIFAPRECCLHFD